MSLAENEEETEQTNDPVEKEPEKKTLPDLDKYWKAVNDDPTDFTAWTYLLQYVDQEVNDIIVFFPYIKTSPHSKVATSTDNSNK